VGGGNVGQKLITVTPDSVSAASANTTVIQTALSGGGLVSIAIPGVVYVNATLIAPSNTALHLGAGVTLRQAPSTSNTMFVNAAYSATPTTIGAGELTSSGLVATLAKTGIGALYAAGSYISIQGVDNNYGFCGVWRVVTSSTNSITWYLDYPFTGTATSAGTMTFRNADVNVNIIGEGIIDYDLTNNNANNTLYGASAVIFYNCHTPKVIGPRIRNAKKYGVWFTNTSDAYASNIHFATASDGVHLCGPSRGVAAFENLSGYCGDDIVGLGNGDNTTGELSRGEVAHVRIKNINGENSAISLVTIVGGADTNMRFKTVEIDGLYGSCVQPALNIYEYVTGGATLTRTYIEKLVVRNMMPSAWSNSGAIYINGTTFGTTIDHMIVENLAPTQPMTGQQSGIWLDTGATVKRLTVRSMDIVFAATTTGGALKMTGNAVATTVEIDGARVSPTSSSNAIVQTNTTNTLGKVFLSNSELIGNTAGYLAGLGCSCDFNITNVFSSTTNSAFNVLNSGAVVNLYTKNWKNSAGSTTPTLAVSGATLNWFGDCDMGTTAKGTVNSGATFRANGNMRVDASFITTSQPGDTFYNTNTAWASGTGTDKSGFYGYNGTTYTKLFGPA